MDHTDNSDDERWHKDVYHPGEPDMDANEYEALKQLVMERENYKCQACGRKYSKARARLYLSAHHVKPRAEGGLSILSNLECLCRKCHDLVEEGRIEDIRVVDNTARSRPAPASDDWHTWVYGGCDRPN